MWNFELHLPPDNGLFYIRKRFVSATVLLESAYYIFVSASLYDIV